MRLNPAAEYFRDLVFGVRRPRARCDQRIGTLLDSFPQTGFLRFATVLAGLLCYGCRRARVDSNGEADSARLRTTNYPLWLARTSPQGACKSAGGETEQLVTRALDYDTALCSTGAFCSALADTKRCVQCIQCVVRVELGLRRCSTRDTRQRSS